MNTGEDFNASWDSCEPAMQEVLNAARIVAVTDVNTLILGESGSGKAQLGRGIHAESHRRRAPFVTVHCAALLWEQAAPLLFGRAGGDPQVGYLRAADGGTLFLRDVDALGAEAQSGLMQFIESGTVLPVDGTAALPADVRIIATSAHDLARAVREGRFRGDLYYRLQVVPLTVPALRERPRDIASLARGFLDRFAQRHALAPVTLDDDALCLLTRQRWPGNVRELRNLCERLALLLPGREVGVANLPPEYRAARTVPGSLFALPSDGLDLAELEKDLIAQALQRTGGNRSRAARLLGLTRDTLLYRLKKFSLV